MVHKIELRQGAQRTYNNMSKACFAITIVLESTGFQAGAQRLRQVTRRYHNRRAYGAKIKQLKSSTSIDSAEAISNSRIPPANFGLMFLTRTT